MHPGNPIYAIPNVPFVLALSMGTIYFVAMLIVVGKAWLKSPRFLLSTREEPALLSDTSAIAYGLAGMLYVVTALAIHHHASATALSWLDLVLWIHVLITFMAWGHFRFPPFYDAIITLMTSANLAMYTDAKLLTPFTSWFNFGQSVTMYVLEVTALVMLIWALIGPKGRRRMLNFITEDR